METIKTIEVRLLLLKEKLHERENEIYKLKH